MCGPSSSPGVWGEGDKDGGTLPPAAHASDNRYQGQVGVGLGVGVVMVNLHTI